MVLKNVNITVILFERGKKKSLNTYLCPFLKKFIVINISDIILSDVITS